LPDQIPEYSYATRRGRTPVDPAMRRMALGAGGVSILVVLVALAWSGEKPGIGFGPPPVITAPPGPLRVQPTNPGGLTVPEANEQIMSGAGAAPPQLGSDGPAPAIAQLTQAAGLTPVAPPAPEGATPPTPAVAPLPATLVAPAPQFAVELAAAPDEADVENVWSLLLRGLPDLIGNRQPDILPVVVNGNSLWHLRLGGFASEAAARAFCAQLIAKGAACTVPSR
jgi:hypothetical protein